MRSHLFVCLLIATATVAHAEPTVLVRPHSADILLRLHPLAWRAPVATTAAAAIRLEPDTGAPSEASQDASALAPRHTHPLAGVPVQTRADGSRFAVLGGKLRSYSVVSIGADGRLEQECVHSEHEAIERVRATSRNGGR